MRTEPPAAVTFDFWETLVQDTPKNFVQAGARRVQSLAALLASAGCAQPSAAVEQALERCWTVMTERFWTTDREPSIQDQVRLFFDCLDEGLVVKDLADLPRLIQESI